MRNGPLASRGLMVGLARLLSTILTVTILGATALRAHEIQPAISDLTVTGERLDLTMELTLEPLIAGVDLDGLLDTNASEKAAEVDMLRALPPDALAARFRDFWPEFADGLTLLSDGQRIALDLVAVEVPEVGEVSLPRVSLLTMTGTLPPGDAPITVAWPASFGALVVRQQGMGEDGYTGYMTGGATSDPIARGEATVQPHWRVFLDYIGIGYEHIVPKGLDHILFVLGLFFLSLKMRPLLWQISAFTVAHTITLALATLEIVTIPASVVEPLIAASIAYVGIENVFTKGLSPWRPAVVFGFGLLHGLGFASVLGDIGLNPTQFLTGLIGFNVGVELGQLSVIATAFVIIALPFGNKPWYRNAISTPASLIIAAVGIYWALERTGVI